MGRPPVDGNSVTQWWVDGGQWSGRLATGRLLRANTQPNALARKDDFGSHSPRSLARRNSAGTSPATEHSLPNTFAGSAGYAEAT